MAQIMPVPGPSQDDFDALSGQVTALDSKIVISNEGTGKNLNDYLTEGWYRFSGNLTNSPQGNYGLLFVKTYSVSGSTFGRQFWFPEGSSSVYVRRLYETIEPWYDMCNINMITTDTFTSGNENIAAGERKTIVIPISKTGYTPIGIVSLYTTETQVMAFTTFYINGSNVVVGLHNTYNEARNGKTIVRVLFLKN